MKKFYFLTYIWIAVLYLLVQLPLFLQYKIANIIGFFSYYIIPRRRHIAETNIKICFPDLDEKQRKKLVKDHFKALSIGIFELGMAWWAGKKRLENIYTIEGLEHLDKALEKGCGVLLLSAHFTTLEITGRLVNFEHGIVPMYRKNENPVIEYFLQKNRDGHCEYAIPREDIRAVLKALKKNHIVWYAPDQSFKGKHSLLVPFFKEPAATNTATSRIAKISKAAVIPFFSYRKNGHYYLKLAPALENFPTADLYQDSLYINQIIEQAVLDAPEQYFWLHRKFKKRKGLEDPY